jgi:hypothetical protein
VSSTTASELALLVSERVAAIQIANAFNTDVGLKVYRGKLSLNLSDLPCVVIVEGDDTTEDQRKSEIKLQQQYVIEAHHSCDPLQPNDTAHLLLKDLKRAIFGGDVTFGGRIKRDGLKYLGRAIGTRADGTNICAASITIAIEYVEDLGNP